MFEAWPSSLTFGFSLTYECMCCRVSVTGRVHCFGCVCALQIQSTLYPLGSEDSSGIRAPDSWSIKSRVRIPAGAAGKFLLQGQLSVLTLISVSVPPPCYRSIVARERSRSFCQKCRWQVTAKHACSLRMWLCVKWHVRGCMVYTERAETAAVSRGTSHVSTVSTPLLRGIFKNALYKS